mgnify:CR=1 FL=1
MMLSAAAIHKKSTQRSDNIMDADVADMHTGNGHKTASSTNYEAGTDAQTHTNCSSAKSARKAARLSS